MIKRRREAAVVVKNSGRVTRLVKLASSGLGYLLTVLAVQYRELAVLSIAADDGERKHVTAVKI